MKKSTKKIDTAIILVLVLLIGISIIVPAFRSKSSSSQIHTEPETTEDYRHSRIGILTGSNVLSVAEEYFPEAEYVFMDELPDIVLSLSKGKIDGYIADSVFLDDYKDAYPLMGCVDKSLGTSDIGAMFAKNEKSDILRSEYNEFIKKIRADGRYDELVRIWIDEKDESKYEIDDSMLTGENGTIKVASNSGLTPFCFYRNGRLAGFDIAMVTLFCEQYGYGLELYDSAVSSIVPGIASGKYDFAVGNFTITEERKQSVNFSDITYSADIVLVIYNAYNSPAAVNGTTQISFLQSVKNSFRKTFIDENRWQMIGKGIATTMVITLAAFVLGTVLAFLICMFRRTGSRLANRLCDIFIGIMQGTPVLVFLMIFYYIVFGSAGLSPVIIAIIAFSIEMGAVGSVVMMSGIESIDKGQREAAIALGYTENQAFFKFVLPQAALRFIPVYSGEFVSMLKATSIVGYIAIQDLAKTSDIIRSVTYDAFFPLISTALIYLAISWIIILAIDAFCKKIDPKKKGARRK